MAERGTHPGVKLQLPGVLLAAAGVLVLLVTLVVAVFWTEEYQLRLIEEQTDPERAAEMREDFESFSRWHLRGVGTVLGILIGGGMLAGGIAMVRARAWWLALIGAALALVPCQLCCCLAGPLGTWALVILFQGDVKRAFGVGGGGSAPLEPQPQGWSSPPA